MSRLEEVGVVVRKEESPICSLDEFPSGHRIVVERLGRDNATEP
jgi:hypothetical protein